MSFFDDEEEGGDPFNSIFREFFGPNARVRTRRESVISGEEEDRTIDFIETPEFAFLIFELAGYNENDLSIAIKNNRLEIKAQKHEAEEMQDYLAQKLNRGIIIKKTLPEFINKRFSHTMHNGILEIKFSKK